MTPRTLTPEEEEILPRNIICLHVKNFFHSIFLKQRLRLLRLAPKAHWKSNHDTREKGQMIGKDFCLIVLAILLMTLFCINQIIWTVRLLKKYLNKQGAFGSVYVALFPVYKTLSNRILCIVQEISVQGFLQQQNDTICLVLSILPDDTQHFLGSFDCH